MCGIFGTTNPTEDLIPLIKDNLERGAQALSLFSPNFRLVYDNPTQGMWLPVEEPWILGHCQAPTSGPSPDRHPFQWRDWFVAHNGVIHNEKALRSGFTIWPWTTDSGVLSWLIAERDELHRWMPLNWLDGTFACWVHNSKEKQTYLFSWVNPIYHSPTKFSSKEFEGGWLLPEGTVIKWPYEEVLRSRVIEPVEFFKGRSHPYIPSKENSPL